MVSTRLMSTVGNSSGDSYGQTQVPGPSKLSRNNLHQTTIVPYTSSDINIADKSTSTVQINLLNLPTEIIEKILSFVNFKTVCNTRLVCRTTDIISGQILNSTFLKLQTQMLNRFHAIKSKMPRRESARRNHHLACESDIIETLHMRLTLLQMSFGKHIERKHCCFFPGEILDEVYNILNYIKITPKLARPYKVTDELFDLSTMAMEYFKEKIEPDLPEIAYFGTDFLDFTGRFSSTNNGKYLALDSSPLSSEEVKEIDIPSCSSLDSSTLVEPLPQSNMVLRKRIRKIKQGLKRYNSQLSLLRQDLRTCKRKTSEQQKQISEQQKQLAEQQKQTLEYAARLDEYDKKNEEISRKFSTMLQELNKCKTELQYWRSKSPATTPSCFGCGNIIRPSIEDLQPLINQGIVLDGLDLNPSEECNFVPIASTSSENQACITNAEVELINKDHAVEESSAMNSESSNLSNEKKGTKRKLNETPATSNSTTKRQLQKGRSKRIKV